MPNIKISDVKVEEELVILQVLKDTNLKNYAIGDRALDKNDCGQMPRGKVFYLPDWKVSQNDFVRVYIKKKGQNICESSGVHKIYLSYGSDVLNNTCCEMVSLFWVADKFNACN